MTRAKPSIDLTEEERAAMERLAERDNELSAFADVLCQLDENTRRAEEGGQEGP